MVHFSGSVGILAICLWLLPLILSITRGVDGVSTSVARYHRPDACTPDGEAEFCVCNVVRNTDPNVVCNQKRTDYIPGGLPNVTRTLFVIASGVKGIYERDFMGLENLTSLSLQENAISAIHPKAFRNLYRLEKLNIERNPIVRLDPSGRTFQHLMSLKNLYLNQADITHINEFSFFSFGGANQSLTVYMKENPVQCDCNVKGLRNWQHSLTSRSTAFQNLRCANANGLPYDDAKVDDSVLGTCPQQSSNLFEKRSICYDCRNENTNYACKQRGNVECAEFEGVCRESVLWDVDRKQMRISSGCFSYQGCLAASYKNKNDCGIGYKSLVNCVFCCLGPTCDFTTIGGRTVDYTFDVRYVRGLPYELYLDDPSSSGYQAEARKIRDGVTEILTGINAGFDVYLSRFQPELDSRHMVILRIQVTALNTITSGAILGEISSKLHTAGSTQRGFLKSQLYEFGSLRIATISQANSPFLECQNETTTGSTGTFHWPKTLVGVDAHVRCPIPDPVEHDVTAFAIRKCEMKSQKEPQWSAVEDRYCTTPGAYLDKRALAKTSMEDQIVAKMLITVLEELFSTDHVLSVPDIEESVDFLERVAKSRALGRLDVSREVVPSVSAIMDSQPEALRQAQLNNATNHRLLEILDEVTAQTPFIENRVHIVSPQVVVAAQGIGRQEKRKIVMTVKQISEDDVQIDMSFRSQWDPAGETGISIPLDVVRDSLSANQQKHLERATFVTLEKDNLFYVNPSVQEHIAKENDRRCLYKSVVNSQVIGARIRDVKVEDLKETILISFVHVNKNETTHPQCVYWDTSLADGQGGWGGKGCDLVDTSNTSTICGCNHLSYFALLTDTCEKHISDLSSIPYIGCGVCLFFLLLTLVIYSFCDELEPNNPSKILCNLCLALFLSNLVFVAGMQEYAFDNKVICKVVAVLLHYFLLVSLTWIAVDVIYLYLVLVSASKSCFIQIIPLIVLGTNLVTIGVTLGINSTENYGLLPDGVCWIKNPVFYYAFFGPAGLIFLIFCVAFGLVIWKLAAKSPRKIVKPKITSMKCRLAGAVSVFILFHLTCGFAIVAIDSASDVFYYLFAGFNSLLGLFIFLFYCLFKKEVRDPCKRCLPRLKETGCSCRTMKKTDNAAQTKLEKSPSVSLVSETCQHATRLNRMRDSSVDAKRISATSIQGL